MFDPHAPDRPAPALRINLDPEDVGRGFGQVIIAVAEVLRELLERQAIRRIDRGDLNEDQIERLGTALLNIRHQLADLRETLAKPEHNASKAAHPEVLSTAESEFSRKDAP